MRRVWVVVAVGVVAVVAASGGAAVQTATADPATAGARAATATASPADAQPPVDVGENESDGVSVHANATYASGESVTITVAGQQGSLYAVYLYDEDGTAICRAGQFIDLIDSYTVPDDPSDYTQPEYGSTDEELWIVPAFTLSVHPTTDG